MNTARLHAAVFEPIEKVLDAFCSDDMIRPTERNDTTTRRYITMTANDPHEAEYLAAASAIHEQTPPPCQLPAVGDFVSGMTAGKRWSGYVQSIEPRRLVVEATGAWLVVDPADITH